MSKIRREARTTDAAVGPPANKTAATRTPSTAATASVQRESASRIQASAQPEASRLARASASSTSHVSLAGRDIDDFRIICHRVLPKPGPFLAMMARFRDFKSGRTDELTELSFGLFHRALEQKLGYGGSEGIRWRHLERGTMIEICRARDLAEAVHKTHQAGQAEVVFEIYPLRQPEPGIRVVAQPASSRQNLTQIRDEEVHADGDNQQVNMLSNGRSRHGWHIGGISAGKELEVSKLTGGICGVMNEDGYFCFKICEKATEIRVHIAKAHPGKVAIREATRRNLNTDEREAGQEAIRDFIRKGGFKRMWHRRIANIHRLPRVVVELIQELRDEGWNGDLGCSIDVEKGGNIFPKRKRVATLDERQGGSARPGRSVAIRSTNVNLRPWKLMKTMKRLLEKKIRLQARRARKTSREPACSSRWMMAKAIPPKLMWAWTVSSRYWKHMLCICARTLSPFSGLSPSALQVTE